AVWLDLMFELSPQLRLGLLATALVAAALVLVRLVRKSLQQSVVARLARRMDEVSGTQGQILSGVGLAMGGAPGSVAARPALGAGLARLAVDRATQLANGVQGAAVASMKPLGRSAGSLAGLAVLAAIMAMLFPRLALTEWRRFTDPFGDHPPFSTVQFEVDP